jgi:hypothetical protein
MRSALSTWIAGGQLGKSALETAALLAVAAWLGLLTLFAVRLPLCCADDASFAVVSKNLASGYGYLLTLGYFTPDFSGSLFDAYLGTGPTSILPVALAIRIFGDGPSVPGLVQVSFIAALLFATHVLLRRGLGPKSASGTLVVLVLLCTAVSVYHLEQWHAQLGEVPAALLVVLGMVSATFVDSRPRAALLCGAALGCAVLAKHLAAIYLLCPVLFVVLDRLHVGIHRRSPPQELWWLLWLWVATAVPIAAFELWKWSELGTLGWREHWMQFGDFLRHQGLSSGEPRSLIAQSFERAEVVKDRFSIAPVTFLVSLVGLCAGMTSMEPRARALSLSLLAGLLVHMSYWMVASNGWPRYLFVGVVVYCFLVAVVLFATRSYPSRVLLAACAAIVVFSAAPRFGFQAERLVSAGKDGPSDIESASHISALIDQLSPNSPVATEWWAHVAALEYLSKSRARYEGFDERKAASIRYLVLNEKFLIKSNAGFVVLLERCRREVARFPPYVLRECR